jgi:PAS domain S-box-containing protein
MTSASRKIPKDLMEDADIRRRAEARHTLNYANSEAARTEVDTERLVHELQVHQIELEIQNEELQRTRAEVEAGLEQYTDLYDYAPVGYFTLAKDGRINQSNLKGANLLGVERAQIVGRPLSLFIATSDRPLFDTFLKKVFETQAKEACEVTLSKKASPSSLSALSEPGIQEVPFQCVVSIEAVSGEDKLSCRAIMSDISERRLMENHIRYLSSFPQSNPNPEIEISRDRKINYMNPAASNILAQLNQEDARVFIPPDFDRMIKKVESGSETQFYRMVKIGEHIFGENIHVAPQLDGLRLYIIDITMRVRAEEEIRRLNAELEIRVADRTRELLSANLHLNEEINQRIEAQNGLAEEHKLISTILNNANALIVVVDREDRIVIFNQFCEMLTGINSQDAQGKSLFGLNLIPSDELSPFREFYFKFKQNSNAKKFYYEYSWIGQDSRNHRIGWSVAAITGMNGRLEFMVFLGLDLTENRNLRESLRESEEKYRKLFLNLPVSTLEVAIEKNRLVIVDANYQAYKTYGSLIALSSKPILAKIFAPDRKKDVVTIKKQSNYRVRLALESRNIRSNGETFPVRINISFESEVSNSHFILVIEDITSEINRRSEEKAISEERARMAREIHDGVAQDLVTLIMRSYSWKEMTKRAPENFNLEIEFLQNLLNNDIQEVRRSIFALRPLSLNSEGFFPSITRYVKDFGALNKITTHLLPGYNAPNLVEELEISIFRMIQESLNNVTKYARANNVWISFKNNSDQSITIEIKDDGVGFKIQDLDNIEHQGHYGLRHMQDRVRENQGKFIITSEINQGVTIQISLPIREKLV